MKKIISIIILFLMTAGVLTACTNEPVSFNNAIAPKELSQEQQDIVDLLSSDKRENLLFDYETKDAYTSMKIWVEVYEYGELVDTVSFLELSNDEPKALNGQMVAMIDHNTETNWTFTLANNGSSASGMYENLTADSTSGRGYGSIGEPVEIEAGKEITLYTSLYTNEDFVVYVDKQKYIEEPELLSDYPYVYMIICRFD